MDPSHFGLNALANQDFLTAAGVEAAYIQLSAVVLQGVAIIGGAAKSASASSALYLFIVNSLAAEVVRLQPEVGSARRRLAATGSTLSLTDAATITSILTSASAAAVAAGSIPASSAPSAASISAVAAAVASINSAIASVTSGGITSSTAFLNTIASLNGISYVSSTSLLASVNALASGSMSLAAFSTATAATALSTLISNTDITSINAALYCSYLASATNNGGVSASRNYNSLCLALSPSPPPSPPVDDLKWIIPLIVVTVVGLSLIAVVVAILVRRRHAETSLDAAPLGSSYAAPLTSLVLLGSPRWDAEVPGLRQAALSKRAGAPAAGTLRSHYGGRPSARNIYLG